LSEHKGTVRAKSQYGIKFSEDGPWFNWAKSEKRGTPFHDVAKGDSVRIEYSSWEKDDGSKAYNIYVIENLSRSGGVGPQDDPFPSDEGFPGDEAGTPFPSGAPDATSDTSEAAGQTLWAKDRLRARTDCIACATGIYKSSLEAGILKTFPPASEIVQYAETLELWAKE
jgi:hypothetical protein